MSEPISRRKLLGAAGLAIVVTGCGGSSSSQLSQGIEQPPPQPDTSGTNLVSLSNPEGAPRHPALAQSATTSLLFVQSAASGSIQPLPGEPSKFVLVLKDVGPTIVFSDRPQRFFRSKSTASFVAEDFAAFGSVFPNAVLEVRSGGLNFSTVLTLLSAAVKDGNSGEISYVAKAVPAQTPSDYQGGIVQPSFLPATFEQATLFIDDLTSDTATNENLAIVSSNQLRLTANFTVRMTAGQSQTISIQNLTNLEISVQVAVGADSPIVLEVDPFPLRVLPQSRGVITLQARPTTLAGGPRDLSTQLRIVALVSNNTTSFDLAFANLQLHVPFLEP